MKTIKDVLWLWGQNPGTHHMADQGVDNPFNLPGVNRMTPKEGLSFFHIPNLCRVVFQGVPMKPYDDEMKIYGDVSQMIWSIADYGNNGRIEDPEDDLREVLRQASAYPNIKGAIMDDFFTNDYHFQKFKPAQVAHYQEQLHTAIDRELDFWVVIYTRDFGLNVKPYLEYIDVITMWTWNGKDLANLERNLAQLKELGGPDKKYLAGCYMWDYGDAKPLSPDLMRYQLDTYEHWLKTGEIEGVIFCSNCIADLGIHNVDLAREWIEKHQDDII